MQKIYIIMLLSTLFIVQSLAQNTVEDIENQPVVKDLAPSVIDMPMIEDETVLSSGLSLDSGQTSSKDSNQSTLETINGVIQKKVKKSKDSTVTELDEEAPEVEGLEPAGVVSL